MEIADFTRRHIQEFKNDLNLLGIKPAEKYPRASDHTGEMVSLSEKLVRKGVAYEKLRSIYFDISQFKTYGRLSGVDIDKIRLGATVDLDEYEKDNPRDFTLLKRSKLSELKRGIYIKTEWGNIRPSWHLQCVAMSMKYLGDSYDIHTASRELAFPHHENEIAIAGALTGKPLARFWVHCDRVLVDGKKMDEKGDGLTIQHLMDMGFSGREIRYWLISSHYRMPVQFARAKLINAKNSLKRMDSCLLRLQELDKGAAYPDLDQLLYDIRRGFVDAMDDDLNISAALAAIFKMIKKINRLISEHALNRSDAAKITDVFKQIDGVLNLFEFQEKRPGTDVQRLMKKRDQARQKRNWDLADQIRDELISRGIAVRDRERIR